MMSAMKIQAKRFDEKGAKLVIKLGEYKSFPALLQSLYHAGIRTLLVYRIEEQLSSPAYT